MLGSGLNLITTVIGFVMSATFIVFICARLICGRMRWFESRPMFEIYSRIDLELPEYRVTGLQPAVVAAIPTMKFTREAFSSLEDAQCTICLGEYEENEVLRIMPKYGHSFHLSCIDVWLRKQSTCPVCRLSVDDPFKAKYVGAATLEMARTINTPEIVIEHIISNGCYLQLSGLKAMEVIKGILKLFLKILNLCVMELQKQDHNLMLLS